MAGSVQGGAEVLSRVGTEKPNLVLLDQSIGLKNALQLIAEMRAIAPGTHGVLWVNDLAEMECLRCLQAGARGIVKKTQPVSVLLECLRTVASGSLWLEHSIARPSQTFAAKRTTPRFTPREQEIVQHVCRGLKNKEIAEALKITPGTVKVHLMHIFEKAGVRDRFELALQGNKLLGVVPEAGNSPLAAAPPA